MLTHIVLLRYRLDLDLRGLLLLSEYEVFLLSLEQLIQRLDVGQRMLFSLLLFLLFDLLFGLNGRPEAIDLAQRVA